MTGEIIGRDAELSVVQERRASAAAEVLTREGTGVRFAGSIHVPAQRAGLEPLRVVEAVPSVLGAQGLAEADVATEVGFFDQAHLTHRFRRFLGVTPGRFPAG